jgi:excinuclease ABC subunit C
VELVGHAQQNAADALGRHLAERASQQKVLAQLQAFLEVPHPLERIEIYDNSHLQGKHAYGVMVVATPEGFLKKAYRKFMIPACVTPGDDYAMMREVFSRRFPRQEGEGSPLPDLILIDGGKGQLGAVHGVLSANPSLATIPLVAISKGPQRNAGQETLHRLGKEAVQLTPQDPLLYYFQRLRDEAHRFAITTHRKKRTKELGVSRLDAVPGVGAARKKGLLRHFGSLEGIKRAGVGDLAAAPGISRKLAESIYAHFQNHG